jgi:hypothetical protein
MNSYYNLFVGTENGLLKGNYSKYYRILTKNATKIFEIGVNSHTKSFNNLNNLDNLNKDQEIVYMNWTSIIQDKVNYNLFNILYKK